MLKLKAIIDYNKALFEPDPKTNKYSCRLIIDEKNTAILKKAVEEFKAEHATIKKWRNLDILDAGEKYDENDRVQGMSYFNAKTGAGHEPYKRNRAAKKVEAEDVDVYFYSGCEVIAYISLFKYKYDGNGIGFGLVGLQSQEVGERLFVGQMTEPEFEALPPIDVDDLDY